MKPIVTVRNLANVLVMLSILSLFLTLACPQPNRGFQILLLLDFELIFDAEIWIAF